jgi:type II secretory pathway component PulF
MTSPFSSFTGMALPGPSDELPGPASAAGDPIEIPAEETLAKRVRKPSREQRLNAKAAELNPDGILVEKRPLFTIVGKKSRIDDIGETLEDLASMLESGESEEHALSELSKHYAKTNVGMAYGRAAEKMRERGDTIIEALVAETDVFPSVARELIAAASTPRDLHANLRHAALIIVEGSDIKAKVKSALFKPMMTLVIVILFILGSAEFLLPGVAKMFESINAEVPPMTVTMIAFGHSLKWVMGGIALIVLAWLGFWAVAGRKNPKLRILRDTLALRAPMIGPIAQMAAAARFTEVLSACLASGMTELDGLEVAGRACGNEAIDEHVKKHIIKQRIGQAVFVDVADTPLFPWNLKNRIEVAPSPRQRITVMKDLAQVFHKKSHRKLESFTDQIGPITEIFVLSAAAVVILMVAIPVTTFAPALVRMSGQ